MEIKEGMIVEHPVKKEWGPGKVIAIKDDCIHAFFRDYTTEKVTKISTNYVSLQIAEKQEDPILDNIPPLKEDNGVYRLPNNRLTLEQAIGMFKQYFPMGFSDPTYLGDNREGERNYKVWAHEKWVDVLGDGQAKQLLDANEIKEISERALTVISKVNLLSPYENMAIQDAFKDDESAKQFFRILITLLDEEKMAKEIYEPYANAVCNLPQEKGKSRVATWPVATILPFLAQPDRHMFLKPSITQNAAETLGFDLHYNSTPNWVTYEALLRMSEIYKKELKSLAPKDNIDIQSFFWVVSGKYY